MTFPLAKLGFLFLKQLTRPLANFIKNEAKAHPYFRKHFCIPPARAYHWIETHTGLIKKRGKVTLSEEEAVELGANLLGEAIVFSLLSVILFLELARQGDKKATIEKMKQEEIRNVIETVSSLMEEVNDIKDVIKRMKKRMDSSLDDMLDIEDPKYTTLHDSEDSHWSLKAMLKSKLQRKRSEYEEEESSDPDSP